MNIFKISFYKPIIWAVIIMALCTMKMPSTEQEVSSLIPNFDKFVHYSLYFILALLFLASAKQNNWKFSRLKTIIICASYGLLIELIQNFLDYRTADIYDILANSIGAISGTMSLYLFEKVYILKRIIYHHK